MLASLLARAAKHAARGLNSSRGKHHQGSTMKCQKTVIGSINAMSRVSAIWLQWIA